MEGISDLRIIGIDEKRPPKIRKEPYIDIFFKLSHEAPPDWCRDFNDLLAKHATSPKIKETEGLFVDAWVRTPDEVAPLLELLNNKIEECSCSYIERKERLTQTATNNSDEEEEQGEQGRLNKIIAELKFDEL